MDIIYHFAGYRKLPKLLKTSLIEDAFSKDITSKSFIKSDLICTACIKAEQECIVCGTKILKVVYEWLLDGIFVYKILEDGERVHANTEIARLQGNARKILAAERTVLNFIQRMSSIATYTRKFVDIAKKYGVEVYDTRKTMPGLRLLDKYAVRVGGGNNHRLDLSEDFLFKDNHFALIRNLDRKELADLIKKAIKKKGKRQFIVEAQNFRELKFWLNFDIDVIMLDNMPVKKIKKAVKLIRRSKPDVQIEVSGGVNLENIKKICKTGIDRVSIGSLTSSPPAVNFTLEVLNAK